MGIRFGCIHCGHTLHVKDFLAGKRGICPHCQGKIDIPAGPTDVAQADDGATISVEMREAVDDGPASATVKQSTVDRAHGGGTPTAAVAPVSQSPQPSGLAQGASAGRESVADPIGVAPELHWYVLPAGSMTKYGPAQGELMRAWISEGRVALDSLVWREGWQQWRPAASVFPQLTGIARSATAQAPAAAPAPVVALGVGPTAAAPAVVLALDDLTSAAQPGATRRPAGNRARRHQTLVVGLGVAFALVIAVLIYVLLLQ